MFEDQEYKEVDWKLQMLITEKALLMKEKMEREKEDGLKMPEENEEEKTSEDTKTDEEESPKPEKEKGVIAKNISKNKKVILYYLGVFIVNIAVRASNLLSLIIPDSALGGFANGIATDGVLLITFLAPWIFGGREALDREKKETKRIKIERTGIGIELSRVNVVNEGLRVTNELQAGVREENGLKPYRYDPPADVGLGSERNKEVNTDVDDKG